MSENQTIESTPTPSPITENISDVQPDTSVTQSIQVNNSIYEHKPTKVLLNNFLYNTSVDSFKTKPLIDSKICSEINNKQECNTYKLKIKQDPLDYDPENLVNMEFNDKIVDLGMSQGTMENKAGNFFDKLVEKHKIDVYSNLSKDKENFKQKAVEEWASKQEKAIQYIEELESLFNYENESTFSLPDDINEAQTFIETNAHGLEHATSGSYLCTWDDQTGACYEVEVEDDLRDVVCPEQEPCPSGAPGECPDLMFDQELFDMGGFKITMGLVLTAVAFKLYRDLEKFKKANPQ